MRKSLLLLVVAFALLASACFGFATGGGWIDGKEGGKATFGFNAEVECDKGEVTSATGQVTYHDRSVGLKLKGTITGGGFFGECGDDPENSVWAHGVWRQQGRSDEFTGGLFAIQVTDNGEPGTEDWLKIEVFDFEEFELYVNSGVLHGGNIQYH